MRKLVRWRELARIHHHAILEQTNRRFEIPEATMNIYDARTELFVADPSIDPLDFSTPRPESIQKAFSSMILSASGWRKVFAASGDEEDASENISQEDAILAAFVALSLARHLELPGACPELMKLSDGGAKLQALPDRPENPCTILVGIDARPTGPALANVINRILLACGADVRYLFIAAAPEIMADSSLCPKEADAFLYISASHNPVGHNGIKFGKAGGVYTGAESGELARIMRELVLDPQAHSYVQKLSALLDTTSYEAVLSQMAYQKEQSLERYRSFVLATAADSFVKADQDALAAKIRTFATHHPIGIVAELNGSARGDSIDVDFLTSLGVKVHAMNDKPRQIVHPIVPEGENLELCRRTLEELFTTDVSWQIGYVPDNDGDRGNLVYIRHSDGKAHILQAQEVFALVAVIELADLRRKLPVGTRMAIAVNGPTSMRIESLCEALDVEVHRAEVGEANVVELAQQLRSQGAVVRLLGEGSNGGNITHPAKVRDPMNTIMSLVKFLSSTGDDSIFATWISAIGLKTMKNVSIEAIIDSLPVYTTTGAFSPAGKMQVTCSDHGRLKTAYEKIFVDEWRRRQDALAKEYGIVSWKEYQTEGTVCREGVGPDFRTGTGKGGLKIVFFDAQNKPTDFIWMRGSGTEPVFRVLVDCKGDSQSRHDYLLDWHRAMIAKADSSV